MIEKRYSKQQLEKLYSADRQTIESWVRDYGLPMITISSHSKFVRKSDLLEWENTKMKTKDKLERNECE